MTATSPIRTTLHAAARPRLSSPAAALAVAALGFAAAALIAVGVTGGFRAAVVGVAVAIVPGIPVVRLLRLQDPIARGVLVVVSSVAIETVLALGMVWLRLWYPMPVAGALLLVSGWFSLAHGVRSARIDRAARAARGQADTVAMSVRVRSLVVFGVLVGALALWVVGVETTNPSNLGEWGLLTKLPLTWYLGMALIVGVAIVSLVDRRVLAAVRGIAVSTLVFTMYATANLVESTPRPPWVFKHIAVVEYIIKHGSVNPSIDIYNRWPGFFSVAAFLGEAAGHADPLSYVRWAEVGFALADGALVLAIARTLGLKGRWAWGAALVFSTGNWVGQNYFSPQAFAFVLFLASVLLALTFLRGRPNAFGRWFERIVVRVFRAKVQTIEVAVPAPSKTVATTAITLILLFQAIITTSHQLTPYAMVSALVPLLILGYLRPWWLAIPLVAMPIAYLIPNLSYIESQFGLSSGFNIISNIATPPGSDIAPTFASVLQAKGVLVLTFIIAVVALLGLIRRVRSGHVRRALLTLWLAMSPIVILFGQSYGGEGKYRVVLFATPFLSIAVMWFFHGRLRRSIAMGATVVVLLALWFAATMQAETSVQIPANSIAASKWLQTRFKSNDTVFSAAESFPYVLGSDYPNYLHHWSQQAALTDELSWYHGKMTVADLKTSVKALSYGGHTWFAFSAYDTKAAIASKTMTAKEIKTLEDYVKKHAELRYNRDGVQIYEYAHAN